MVGERKIVAHTEDFCRLSCSQVFMKHTYYGTARSNIIFYYVTYRHDPSLCRSSHNGSGQRANNLPIRPVWKDFMSLQVSRSFQTMKLITKRHYRYTKSGTHGSQTLRHGRILFATIRPRDLGINYDFLEETLYLQPSKDAMYTVSISPNEQQAILGRYHL